MLRWVLRRRCPRWPGLGRPRRTGYLPRTSEAGRGGRVSGRTPEEGRWWRWGCCCSSSPSFARRLSRECGSAELLTLGTCPFVSEKPIPFLAGGAGGWVRSWGSGGAGPTPLCPAALLGGGHRCGGGGLMRWQPGRCHPGWCLSFRPELSEGRRLSAFPFCRRRKRQ